jgi:CspA family cold shock protein
MASDNSNAKATVKWFNTTKGYGFVTLENGGDAFCHASALQALGTPSLQQGATIVCDLGESPRGLQVTTVHSIDNSTADPSAGGGGGGGFGDRGPRPPRPRRDFGDRDGGGFGGGGGFRDRGYGGGGDRFSDRGDRFSDGGGFGGGGRGGYGGGGGGGYGGGGGGGGYRDRDAGPSGPMVDGKVKFFNEQKGFGFVVSDGGGGDVYMHASALRRSGVMALSPEQRIRFSTRQGNKGVEVDRVEVI